MDNKNRCSRRIFLGAFATTLVNVLASPDASACWWRRRRSHREYTRTQLTLPVATKSTPVLYVASPPTTYFKVLRCDNKIVARLTDASGKTTTVFDETTQNDPDLSIYPSFNANQYTINLSNFMRGYGNYLHVVGYNDAPTTPTSPNPYHIKYRVYNLDAANQEVDIIQPVNETSEGQTRPMGIVHVSGMIKLD